VGTLFWLFIWDWPLEQVMHDEEAYHPMPMPMDSGSKSLTSEETSPKNRLFIRLEQRTVIIVVTELTVILVANS
jgi:hypothetical protein